MKSILLPVVLSLAGANASATSQLPPFEAPFEATSLTGKSVNGSQLIGQPTILIVTPSTDAAADTRKWAQALRKNLEEKSIRIRDVLAIDLPFFISEADAIGRAKAKIPARYYDQTWISTTTTLETALNIPTSSHSAFVVVLNAQGRVVARMEGPPTTARMSEVKSAVKPMK